MWQLLVNPIAVLHLTVEMGIADSRSPETRGVLYEVSETAAGSPTYRCCSRLTDALMRVISHLSRRRLSMFAHIVRLDVEYRPTQLRLIKHEKKSNIRLT